jgi:hypothetical protein
LNQIRKHLLNLLNKVKADNNAIQHLDNRKRIVQTEAVTIALVQDVITTDVLTKKLSLSVLGQNDRVFFESVPVYTLNLVRAKRSQVFIFYQGYYSRLFLLRLFLKSYKHQNLINPITPTTHHDPSFDTELLRQYAMKSL